MGGEGKGSEERRGNKAIKLARRPPKHRYGRANVSEVEP